MFNKKKGFTLVEVLAILVILAIIALIAVPSILKITTESKINSIESSAQMLAKAAEDYYSSQIIGGTELEKVNLTDETLIYRGTRPTMGYAYFDEEGRAYIKMYYDGYCVVRNYTGELELQQTEPTDCSIADMVSIVLYYDGGQIITNDKWSINDNYASTVLDFANALTEIPTITKPGYTFLGWWDEDNKQVNLAAPVTKNIKATAKWQANTYTITLDTTGGVVDGGYDNEREVVFNTEYGELPEPTKFGYIFQGWYTAGGLRVEADTILSNPSNHTIYATWEAIKYTVTLNSNGGVFDPHMDWTINGNIASRVTIHGTYYNDLLIPTNTGYTFNGWYTEGGIKVDSSVMVEGELSLYAKWTPNNYVITFKYNDGVTGDTTKEVTYDSTYGTLPTPTRAGYTFTGWLTSGGSVVTKDTIVKVTSNTNLYAQWAVNTYTITFKYNDNKTNDTEKTVTFDKTYGTLPNPTRAGYTFLGWYTALTSGTKIEASQTVKTAKDQILYAIWSQNTYTITFNSNGGTIPSGTNWTGSGTNATKQVIYDNTYGELPNPSKTGYTFNGWATSGGAVINASDTVEIIASTTLYAQWGANSYLVTFDANGGSVTIQNSSIEFNKTYGSKVGELPTPTRTGYTFQGWYSAKTSGTVVTKETTMNTASNHSVYARWQANTYTVTFNRTNFGNGEVVYFNPVTAKVCDASEAVSTTGTKTGCMKWHAFLDDGGDKIKLLLDHNTTAKVAWNADSTGTTPVTALAQLNSDVSSWNSTIKSTARLITATEVNKIAPTNPNWSLTTEDNWYILHTGTDQYYKGAAGTNSYAWLFNNTHNCIEYGCDVAQSQVIGYWTSDYAFDGMAWRISHTNTFFYNDITWNSSNGTAYGIRPVIEINKGLLIDKKNVTYDSAYGTLPILTRPGYVFNGWYTTGGVKIENNTKVSISSNHNVYPQWTQNNYIVTFNRSNFGNGEVVYFNPVTAQVCDASEAVSTTGTKTGCMKWYAFLDDGSDTIKLLLDHNTTGKVAWNNTSVSTNISIVANNQLNSDISNWDVNIKTTARLITAAEVNTLVSTSSNWNAENLDSWYYFQSGNQNIYTGSKGSNNYAWLFNNTNNCITWGCEQSDSNAVGYWTSTTATGGYAWTVMYDGALYRDGKADSSRGGIRPVIEVDKDLLHQTKQVTYKEKYNSLPLLIRANYIFMGWYTTGGIKVDSNTIVEYNTNHTLYPQWIKKENNFTYVGHSQEFIAPSSGVYKIELWGAQGGNITTYNDFNNGGNGAYTSGSISLTKGEKIYIYIGEMGYNFETPGSFVINNLGNTYHTGYPIEIGGWNGGGAGCDELDALGIDGNWQENESGTSGGGATDIRLTNGNWNDISSLTSRIMVASGGSGSNNRNGKVDVGNPAGGLFAENRGSLRVTQFSGYLFGIGQNGTMVGSDNGSSGGGGGYYGGLTLQEFDYDADTSHAVPGCGGTSFISGHTGSVAVSSESSTTPRTDSNGNRCDSTSSNGYNSTGYNTDYSCSIHYSGYAFNNTMMIDGNGYSWVITNGTLSKTQVQMPNPNGGYYDLGVGHKGNGHAKITYLGE